MNITGLTEFSNIPLHYKGTDIFQATIDGDFPLVFMLLSMGAKINEFGKNNATVLHWAAYKGYSDITNLLIQKGADLNLQTNDHEKCTPLMWACMGESFECVKLLVENGANLNDENELGSNALMQAVQKGKLEMVHYLFSKKANFIKDKNHHTNVHWASYLNRFNILKYLVEIRQHPVNVIDDKNRTPLHWAAKQGNTDICKYLVINGCDWKVKDSDSKTALELALEKGHDSLAKLLDNPKIEEIIPETHFEMLSDKKELKEFLKSFFFVFGTLFLCSLIPLWLSIFVWILIMYGMFKIMKETFGKLSRTESFVGWWFGSIFIGSYSFFKNFEMSILCFIILTCLSLLIYSWIYLSKLDPGYIDFNEKEKHEMFSKEEWHEKEFCTTCFIKRPLRSKHDPLTNRCIARFDHYCIWVNLPIGYKNHKTFLTFILLHWLTQLLLIIRGYQILNNIWSNEVFHILILYNSIIFFMVSYLCYSQIKQQATNLTTNEILNEKYTWLMKDDNGNMINLFSEGYIENLKSFWNGNTKWEKIHECITTEYAKQWAEKRGISCPKKVTMIDKEMDLFGF